MTHRASNLSAPPALGGSLDDSSLLEGALAAEPALAVVPTDEVAWEGSQIEDPNAMVLQIAHELKNPLGILLMGTDYLAKKLPPTDSSAARVLEDMRNAIARSDSIARALLNLSSPSSLCPRFENVNRIVEFALSRIAPDLQAKKLKLVRKLASDLPSALIDANRFEHAITHILTNAVEAMAPGATITVHTFANPTSVENGAAPESTIYVQIKDTGKGIPKPILSKVFAPFFTSGKTARNAGLGLTIAKRIVEAHRGEISVSNLGSGGVLASIRLPGRAVASAAAQSLHVVPPSASAGQSNPNTQTPEAPDANDRARIT